MEERGGERGFGGCGDGALCRDGAAVGFEEKL